MFERLIEAIRARLGDGVVLLFAALGVLLSALWIGYTFLSEGTKYSSEKYYDLKLKACSDTVDTVTDIASSLDDAKLRLSAAKFEKLYWGELVLVEDTPLEAAMVAFRGRILKAPTAEFDPALLLAPGYGRYELKLTALAVSKACFDLIQPTVLDQARAFFRGSRKSPE